MKDFTFKRQLLFVMFMLLGCISNQAADDGLITKQIIVKLEKAGTLPDRIGSTKRNKITNLKIIGEINGTDLDVIREMAGINQIGQHTDGILSVLDLSEARIVKGGNYWLFGNNYSTSKDKIGYCLFNVCSGLTSITLPPLVTEIGESAFLNCI